MPTWVKSRVRVKQTSLPRVEALEERWLLAGSPGPLQCGAPMLSPAGMSGSPSHEARPQMADSSRCTASPSGDAASGPQDCGPRPVPAPAPEPGAPPPGGAGGGLPGGTAPSPSPIAAGPVSAETPPPPPLVRGGRAGPADRFFAADKIAAPPAGGGTLAATGPASPQGSEPPGGDGSLSGTPAAVTATILTALFVPSWGGDGGAGLPGAGDDLGGGNPRPPATAPSPPAGQGAHIPDAVAASLPLAQGLLTESVTLGVTAVERAVKALLEPVLSAECGPTTFLYWAGVSSWLVAAALACEGARRSLRRRPTLAAGHPSPSDLPPEADL